MNTLYLHKTRTIRLAIDIRKQQGVALLMSIMIVAMLSIMSIQIITERQIQIHRTINVYNQSQANLYVDAIERWGRTALLLDFQKQQAKQQNYDSLDDVWNNSIVDFDVEQANVNGSIFDLQGRINLNNLVQQGKANEQWIRVYKNLLKQLNLPNSLANTLVDWLDQNELPIGSDGAEDIYYIALDNPYRCSNQALSHLSELFLIKGYTKEVYEKLRPYVFVAPTVTPVNINTSNIVVMQAVIPELQSSEALQLIEEIKVKPFQTIKQFTKHDLIKEKAIEPDHLSVISEYFVIDSEVIIDKSEKIIQSVLYRNNQGGVHLMGRQETIVYEKMSDKEKESA